MAKRKITNIDLISFFMDDVTKNKEIPNTVATFAKSHNIKEDIFYGYYASFKALEKEIFELFFTNTMNALTKDEGYNNFDARNKVLSFYYTFFENLTVNRAYVLIALKVIKKV